jgi:hypothetical protein
MMAKSRSWRRGTRRLSVYNDGPWGFLYDAVYAAELAGMRAADHLIGGGCQRRCGRNPKVRRSAAGLGAVPG